jgi:hypothetical protein
MHEQHIPEVILLKQLTILRNFSAIEWKLPEVFGILKNTILISLRGKTNSGLLYCVQSYKG